MHFEEQTIKVNIDESKCVGCKPTHARRGASSSTGNPGHQRRQTALAGDAAFAREWARSVSRASMNAGSGKQGNYDRSPVPGLDEYRKKHEYCKFK